MTTTDTTYLGLFLGVLLLLILSAELLRHRLHGTQEFSRKFVHMLTGILVAFVPFFVQTPWPLLVIGVAFAAFNYVAVKRGWLQAMHDMHRKTYGTVFYPIAFTLLVLLLWHSHKPILITAMLLLAIGDALAAIVGENIRRPRLYHFGQDKKSLQGTAAMFLSSLMIVVLALYITRPDLTTAHIFWYGALVAVFATACEAVSFQGSDNLTVPLGAALVLHYVWTNPVPEVAAFTFGMILALIVALISLRLRFLSASGAMGLFLLGTMVFGIGRWTFSAPILTFFVLSSLLSKVGRARKKRLAGLIEKGGARDIWQVIANGGVAGLLLIIYYIAPAPLWYFLYAGSLAAVTADTWGTEIGTLASKDPISILTCKRVPVGTSGGISLLGTLGGALGAMVLAGVSWWFSPLASPHVFAWRGFVLVTIAGVLASFLDSYLGATVQAKFKCPECAKITEKKHHCHNHRTEFYSGIRWMNNDVVNIFAAVAGAGFVWVLMELI